MAKRQVVFACLTLGGCDYAFRIDRIDSDASGPLNDGAAACAGAFLDDSFDDGNECAPWGTGYENTGATLRESRNGLTITPTNLGASSAGCITTAALPFRDGGIAVEVSNALAGGGGEYTQLQVFGAVNALIGVSNENMVVVDNNTSAIVMSVEYDPVAMRWWRLRPSTTAAELIGETSPDGSAWNLAAALPRTTIPEDADINLIAGLGGGQTAFVGVATFRRLLVCP